MRPRACLTLCVVLSVAALLGGACDESLSGSAGPVAENSPGEMEMVEVAAFEGTATATTEPFTLRSRTQRLEFEMDRGSGGEVAFAIVDTGGEQRELFDGGVHAASEGAGLQGSSYTELKAGEYVVVACRGARSWSVTLWEAR